MKRRKKPWNHVEKICRLDINSFRAKYNLNVAEVLKKNGKPGSHVTDESNSW